jgi:hypothetical protein
MTMIYILPEKLSDVIFYCLSVSSTIFETPPFKFHIINCGFLHYTFVHLFQKAEC